MRTEVEKGDTLQGRAWQKQALMTNNKSRFKEVFKDENGAIDLTSIMVGIIVIGLIGGVIAATVFAIIPWAQDNAAKQQLDSLVSAQSAYKGLSSSGSLTLSPEEGYVDNSYGSSYLLDLAGLMERGSSYCTISVLKGNGFESFAKSASGKIWQVTHNKTSPTHHTGVLPRDCQYLATGAGYENAPYVDPAPTLTILTYKCATTRSGSIPLNTSLTGTEKWNDLDAKTYSNAAVALPRTLNANVEYTVTFDGTYASMNSDLNTDTRSLAPCLRAVNHWGSETGVTTADHGFYSPPSAPSSLVDVPANIPTTITDMSFLFGFNNTFNDPDVGAWDVSNVTNMTGMFYNALIFNQSLNYWDVSNVTNMTQMFVVNRQFNQPLNYWDTSQVQNMSGMFFGTQVFDQDLDNWDTSNVNNMTQMFLSSLSFNGNISTWDTSKVTNMREMFQNARKFNGDITKWNVSKVQSLSSTLLGATVFNYDLSKWNTVSVTTGANFAPVTFPDAYLPAKTTKAVS